LVIDTETRIFMVDLILCVLRAASWSIYTNLSEEHRYRSMYTYDIFNVLSKTLGLKMALNLNTSQ